MIELFGKFGWMPWRNDGSTDIGPYEIFEKTDVELVDGECVTLGEVPTASGKHFAVNGPQSVPVGGYGIYHPGPEVFVACDDTPQPGELWKPKDGETKATKGSGVWSLRIMGVLDADNDIAKATIVVGTSLTAIELKDSKAPGESAQGWPLTWNGTTHDYDEPDYEDTDALQDVYDPQNRFRSIGYDDTAEGVRGAIVYVDGDGAIVSGQEQATVLSGEASDDVADTDASFVADSVTVVQPSGGQLPTGDITIHNTPGWTMASGEAFKAEFNENSGHYELVWSYGIDQTMVTAFQIDGDNMKFQKKTRTLRGHWIGDESEWTDIHTGDVCP